MLFATKLLNDYKTIISQSHDTVIQTGNKLYLHYKFLFLLLLNNICNQSILLILMLYIYIYIYIYN